MDRLKLVEIMGLKEKSLEELRTRYRDLFGRESGSNNKVFLWRRIAHRVQEIEYGGLSPAADSRVRTLIRQFDPVNNKALRLDGHSSTQPRKRDTRLPIPGTVITKDYKGQSIEVRVLERGFEYKGITYKSLTAIAKKITGAHWNGFLFFNL